MTKEEALKMALEALEEQVRMANGWQSPAEAKAITAIKELLAQPERHQDWCASLTQMLLSMPPKPAPCNCKPPQRTWVGLTDEELDECDAHDTWRSMRNVETKLKEKNT